MRLIICIVFILLSACGPQPTTEPQDIYYEITPQNNGFWVKIQFDSPHYIAPPSYFVAPNTNQSYGPSETIMDLAHGFFQTTGTQFLKCIGTQADQKKNIHLRWHAPYNWKFANSFQSLEREQNFQASCRELRDALYVGGTHIQIRKTPFGAMALDGHANFAYLENKVLENMKRVLEFWGAKQDSYYFVSIRITQEDKSQQNKHGGSAHFQSFQLNLPHTSMENLDRLITHEYFHNWNGIKMSHHPEQDQLDIFWFIEGFTDYYAYKLNNQTPEQKIFSNMSLDKWKFKRLQTNMTSDIFDFPYAQGKIIADQMDFKIRTHSKKELKTLMLDLWARAQKDPLFYLSNETILKTICEGNYMPCEKAQSWIKSYIIEGSQFLI